MLNQKSIRWIMWAGLASGLAAAAFLAGCNSSPSADAASSQPSFALFGPPPDRTGQQLWADTCARCHNMRPPNSFSHAQWEVIVQHMRLRANLTGEEQKKITEFLKSAS